MEEEEAVEIRFRRAGRNGWGGVELRGGGVKDLCWGWRWRLARRFFISPEEVWEPELLHLISERIPPDFIPSFECLSSVASGGQTAAPSNNTGEISLGGGKKQG